MATALLRTAAVFVAGTGAGAVMAAATTGHAQVQPGPRQQPAPRVQNIPSIPPAKSGSGSAPPAPRVNNRTLQSQAAAEKAKADSDARKAEADAKAREAEAKVLEAEQTRKAQESAAAATAEKEKRDAAAAREQSKDSQGYLTTAAAVVAGAVALAAGIRGGAALAKKAADGAKATVKAVNALGKDAAALNKAKSIVAGTPTGDKMKAIVQEADALGRKTNFAGLGAPTAGEKLAVGMKVVGAAEVAASYALPAVAPAIGMSQESADRSAMLLRVTGAAALGAGYGLKAGMAATRTVRPSSRAISSINAGANRLAREGSGGAAAASKNRVQAVVAKSTGDLKVAKAGARVAGSRAEKKAVESAGTVKRARVRTAKSVKNAGKVKSYSRTYKTGRKAGVTETVTLN
jgi:hypothetical protein